MWLNNILLYLISIFILQSIHPGPNIVCNDQLNLARVSVFSGVVVNLLCIIIITNFMTGQPLLFNG